MSASLNEMMIGQETSTRITRIVSVILNGVALQKLARNHENNVNAMAESLMLNLSDVVKNNIPASEIHQVNHSLQMEIGRRISQLPQAE
jgi:Tfp pilus assembly pilus retraction ATPase PilT